jgi:hypothetical protein
MLLCVLVCCYLYTVLYLEHRDCRLRGCINNIISIAGVIWRAWWQSHAQSTGQASLNRRLRSSFPRYAFRDRAALASEITISNLHPPSGTLVSSLVSSQANSIRKYPHTHCLQNYCPRQPADMSILTLPHHISHLALRTLYLPYISPPAAPACLFRPTAPPAVRSRST